MKPSRLCGEPRIVWKRDVASVGSALTPARSERWWSACPPWSAGGGDDRREPRRGDDETDGNGDDERKPVAATVLAAPERDFRQEEKDEQREIEKRGMKEAAAKRRSRERAGEENGGCGSKANPRIPVADGSLRKSPEPEERPKHPRRPTTARGDDVGVDPDHHLRGEREFHGSEKRAEGGNANFAQKENNADAGQEKMDGASPVPGVPEGKEAVEHVPKRRRAQHMVFADCRAVVGVGIPSDIAVVPDALVDGIVVGNVLGNCVVAEGVPDIDTFGPRPRSLKGFEDVERCHHLSAREHRGEKACSEGHPSKKGENARFSEDGFHVNLFSQSRPG